MFPLGFNIFPDMHRSFNTTYHCYPVAMLPGNERRDVERGGKIIMPPSALEQLTRLNIDYPMLFRLTNRKAARISHCGVLEFVADEGRVYLPLWMMHNLCLQEGDSLQVESCALPVGTFSRFQPAHSDFLDISNPKAVLENCLRSFACLTQHDVIAVEYNQRVYELCVLEVKPGTAVTIIECDMNVEFAAPVGYTEPTPIQPPITSGRGSRHPSTSGGMGMDEDDPAHALGADGLSAEAAAASFVPFRGTGNRLDGKQHRVRTSSEASTSASTSSLTATSGPVVPAIVGIPDYDYRVGSLRFMRRPAASTLANSTQGTDDDDDKGKFQSFSGNGFTLAGRG